MVEYLPIECTCRAGQSRELQRRLLGHSPEHSARLTHCSSVLAPHLSAAQPQWNYQRPEARGLHILFRISEIMKMVSANTRSLLYWDQNCGVEDFGCWPFWTIMLSIFVLIVVAYLFLELQRVVKRLGSWTKGHGIKCQLSHFLAV